MAVLDTLRRKGPGGIPVWGYAAGGLVGAYLLYRWYAARKAAAPGYESGYQAGATTGAGLDGAGGGGSAGVPTDASGFPVEDTTTPAGAESTLGTMPPELPPASAGNHHRCPPGYTLSARGRCVRQPTPGHAGTKRLCPPGSHITILNRCAPNRGNRHPARQVASPGGQRATQSRRGVR